MRVTLIHGAVLAASAAFWAAAGGCGPQLETGYKYRPLNATPTERRAYYASPFSPEKAAAEQERKQQNRPSLGPTQ